MSESYTDKWVSEDGSVTLLCGDCLAVLPTLARGSINAVVTSPPYNQRLDQFKASGFKAEGNSVWAERAASAYFDSMPEGEYQDWQVQVLECLHDAAAADCSVFYNHKCRWRDKVLLHPLDIVRRTRWDIRQEIIWARDGSLTQNAKMFPPSEERVIWLYKDSWKWNQDANRWMSVWRVDSSKYSEHPVAYPVDIPKRCILATTDPGDLVVDPFAGSATTGIACVREGRKFLGIEKNPAYFAIARDRIQRELDTRRRCPMLPGLEI